MKKISYIVGCVLVLNLFFSCKSSNLKKGNNFKISAKTYYNWVGGQPGIKGTNLVIKLLKVDLNNFKADSIYFNNKGVKAEVRSKKDTLVVMGYFKTTKVPIRINVASYQDTRSKTNTFKIPYVLKPNEAVLTYFNGGIKKVLRLSDIVKTGNKYYP